MGFKRPDLYVINHKLVENSGIHCLTNNFDRSWENQGEIQRRLEIIRQMKRNSQFLTSEKTSMDVRLSVRVDKNEIMEHAKQPDRCTI